MCLRFVHSGQDVITGFNFDIDLAVWNHKIILARDGFFIGIKVNGSYQTFHGVTANGNASTLLYVTECEEGKYKRSPYCYRIDSFSENYLKGKLSFDDAAYIAAEKKFVNVPNCSMQAMLTDSKGRALIVEPGVGYRVENQKYSLISNYSIIKPERTKDYITLGDDRYERAKVILDNAAENFSVSDAFKLLKDVSAEGLWATRVSFVYSAKQNTVYYVIDNNFSDVKEHILQC